MIPFALLACIITLPDGTAAQCSVEALSSEGFTVRLPAVWNTGITDGTAVTLRWHRLRDTVTWQRTAEDPVTPLPPEGDVHLLRITSESESWRTFARDFMAESIRYTRLKEAEDDAALAQAMVGYDAAGEDVFTRDLAEQRQHWYQSLTPDGSYAEAVRHTQVGVLLSGPLLLRRRLSMEEPAFRAWYGRHLDPAHPLLSKPFSHWLVGDPFCAQLLPEAGDVLDMLRLASREGTEVTLVLPPIPAEHFAAACRLTEAMPDGLPIQVNDWGMADLLHRTDRFTLSMGPLMLKRRKDVRMPLMAFRDDQADLLAHTTADAPWYAAWLRDEMGITRVVLEACGCPPGAPELPVTMMLPFYQMNTAARCTLRAVCEHSDRGRQPSGSTCPRWCSRFCMLYPAGLGMAGIGNTLFGLDRRSLTDGAYLSSLLACGADRLILNLQ